MYQTCPATGRLGHQFDRETHRCKCGRWERGFKPKNENKVSRPRAECQICERQQALDGSGCLGHHGYKRPGWGFIQGDCLGVNHKPYPATDALESYKTALESYVERCRKHLAELPNWTECEYTCRVWNRDLGKREVRKLTIRKGDKQRFDANVDGSFVPGFEDMLAGETRKTTSEINYATGEIARIAKRIAAAKE